MHYPTPEQLTLFASLFRGREDVFARFWEKDGRSGYSPAYSFDWDEFNTHRQKGGTLKTFENKKLVPLTSEILVQHLLGNVALGVYPILPDNTSYFLAADFDGEHWQEDASKYMQEAEKVGLSSYLERSKSGAGGHVWIFFSEPIPCWRSRRIGLELIRRAFHMSEFDKEVSFDRLFPNQDEIEKNGFGNLIALPLQGKYTKHGNSVFINPETGDTHPDQWAFLSRIVRHNVAIIDSVYGKIAHENEDTNHTEARGAMLTICVGKNIRLSHAKLKTNTVKFLKERLNFLSTEYLTKKRLGKSVWKVEKYFKLIGEDGDQVFLPRGFAGQLIEFLKAEQIPFEIAHETHHLDPVSYKSNITLTSAQEEAVQKALAAESGVIVAPPGSGKTMIGMEITARRGLQTLILVHRQQLLDQWVDRIETHLGIPRTHIGKFSGTTKKVGKGITVALLQSLARYRNITELENAFGTIVVDECHHIPAKTFREVIAHLNAKYLYGLTATPTRKHNDEQLIFVYIGDIIAQMDALPYSYINGDGEEPAKSVVDLVIRETGLELPFRWKTDHFQLLAKIISFDTARNKLIINDVVDLVKQSKKILVLSERKEHLEILELMLKGQCETITITGDDSAAKRSSKLKQISDGHYQVILSTGQFFGEGLTVKDVSALVLAFPFSFEGKLVQYLGRLFHGAGSKSVYDYRDKHIPFLERQFKQRQRYYKKSPDFRG